MLNILFIIPSINVSNQWVTRFNILSSAANSSSTYKMAVDRKNIHYYFARGYNVRGPLRFENETFLSDKDKVEMASFEATLGGIFIVIQMIGNLFFIKNNNESKQCDNLP